MLPNANVKIQEKVVGETGCQNLFAETPARKDAPMSAWDFTYNRPSLSCVRILLALAICALLPILARAQGTGPDVPVPAKQAVLPSISGIAVDAADRLYIGLPDRSSLPIDWLGETVIEPGRILKMDANGLLTPSSTKARPDWRRIPPASTS
jgi:hypothetical protein